MVAEGRLLWISPKGPSTPVSRLLLAPWIGPVMGCTPQGAVWELLELLCPLDYPEGLAQPASPGPVITQRDSRWRHTPYRVT